MAPRRETDSTLWRRRIRRAFDSALDFILPPVCVSCRQIGAVFCLDCRRTLSWISGPMCATCGRLLPRNGAVCVACRLEEVALREVRAVCAFEGAARAAVHALKYDGIFRVADPLSALMAQRFPSWSEANDLVIPIPLHPERIRERGYNQAMLLVRGLCRLLDLPYDGEALWRKRPTRPQVGLDRAQRRQNVQGAFAADGARVSGRRVLLLDDVCTSGATLTAAAEALLDGGAAAVRGYCFARPVAS